MKFTGIQKFREATGNNLRHVLFPTTTFVHFANNLFTFAVKLLASKGARTFASLSK